MPQRFAVRYNRWLLPLLWALGLGPRQAIVALSENELLVQMGWAFRARIPRHTIAQARRRGPIWYTAGAHSTLSGRWIINASAQGIVALTLTVPCPARTLGIPIRFQRLDIGLQEPEAFLVALGTLPSDA
jgi:hypothetical protein